MSVATSIIAVRVPLAIRRRPGRKTDVMPEGGSAAAPSRTSADPALVKALARAFRYQRLLGIVRNGSGWSHPAGPKPRWSPPPPPPRSRAGAWR
jgi:hypothetical protein